MSSEVWNIKVSAGEYFNNVKESRFNDDVIAVLALTRVCEKMTNAYDEILQDQNDYLIELEGELDDFSSFKTEQNEKIQELFNDIKVLEQKEQDGTITEDEQKELESKKSEYHSLTSSLGSTISEKNNKIKEVTTKQDEKYRSKVRMAEDFGKTTVEKGTPIAEDEAESITFMRLFSSDIKGIGENAVDVGNNLLDKVSKSTEIDAEFNEKMKTKK